MIMLVVYISSILLASQWSHCNLLATCDLYEMLMIKRLMMKEADCACMHFLTLSLHFKEKLYIDGMACGGVCEYCATCVALVTGLMCTTV